MIHLGDITKINGAAVEPVDCITFGSPCQDLSVAGKRAGLAGERSGLFMEATRIIKEMREKTNGNYPKFAIWENVVGAFSSNSGEDFRAVLEELARCVEPGAVIPGPVKGKWAKAGCIAGDGWSIAWRTFDAQFWGVPQRRRRIAAVLDLGGQRAGEVLFEQSSLSGNPEPKCLPWKAIARDPQERAGADDRLLDGAGAVRDGVMCLLGGDRTNQNCHCAGYIENKSYTLSTVDIHSVVYGIGSYASNIWKSANPNSGVYEADVSKTLDASNCGYPGCNQGGMAVCEPQGYWQPPLTDGITGPLDVSGTLDTRVDIRCRVVEPIVLNDQGGASINVEAGGVSPTLRAQSHQHEPIVAGPVPCTVQIRGGCEGDGKGALVQYDRTGALTCMQDKTLFQPVIYDARGNGDGKIAPTITGDHENRVTDYTAVAVEPQTWDGSQIAPTLTSSNTNGAQRMPDKDNFNCVLLPVAVDVRNQRITDEAGTIQAKASGGYSLNYIRPVIVSEGNGTVCAETFHCTSLNESTPTLKARDYKDPLIVTSPLIHWIVRRLTPMECERLQGFPDAWTDIGEWTDSKGKLHKPSDSPRYKALGNSIALPQWWWITCKMAPYLPSHATLASLFDGIGGFPLLWETLHGIGTARWASEIEEFPIAVTKLRFPEPEIEIEDWM